MSEVVFDRLGRRQVILAPERAQRGAPEVEVADPDPEPCRFCEGQEAQTPPEVYAIRKHGTEPDTPGWRVRVVPNLYPATAAHEVMVHSPAHGTEFEDLVHGMRRAVILAYRARLSELDVASSVIVWNRGKAAGASRSHPHGQIFGLDRPPPVVEREVESFAADPCVLCELTARAELVVASMESVTVVANPAPLVAHELVVVPGHAPSLAEVESGDLGALADGLAQAILALRRGVTDRIPFNLVFHFAPRGVERFHWHAHIYPRLATWGGLELGTELPIVAADPLQTAAVLRDSSRS